VTQEFAAYLLTLSDLGKTIWLRIYSEAAPNGCAIVDEKVLHTVHGIDPETLKVVFKPDLAHQKKFVHIDRPGNHLIINFKKVGRKTNITKALAKIEKAEKSPTSNLPAVQETFPALAGESRFELTTELRKQIIGDYVFFFKSRQAAAAMMIGQQPTILVAPKIKDAEAGQFRNIAAYFHEIGCDTEEKIIAAFRRVYNSWDILPDFYRNGLAPASIYRNLNEIIAHITTYNPNKNNKQAQKNDKFNSAISKAESKDYSHLERRGKKDN
jgi:hypothetical protein